MKKQNFFLLRKNLKENHTHSFLIYGGGGGGYNNNDDECNDYLSVEFNIIITDTLLETVTKENLVFLEQ